MQSSVESCWAWCSRQWSLAAVVSRVRLAAEIARAWLATSAVGAAILRRWRRTSATEYRPYPLDSDDDDDDDDILQGETASLIGDRNRSRLVVKQPGDEAQVAFTQAEIEQLAFKEDVMIDVDDEGMEQERPEGVASQSTDINPGSEIHEDDFAFELEPSAFDGNDEEEIFPWEKQLSGLRETAVGEGVSLK